LHGLLIVCIDVHHAVFYVVIKADVPWTLGKSGGGNQEKEKQQFFHEFTTGWAVISFIISSATFRASVPSSRETSTFLSSSTAVAKRSSSSRMALFGRMSGYSNRI